MKFCGARRNGQNRPYNLMMCRKVWHLVLVMTISPLVVVLKIKRFLFLSKTIIATNTTVIKLEVKNRLSQFHLVLDNDTNSRKDRQMPGRWAVAEPLHQALINFQAFVE